MSVKRVIAMAVRMVKLRRDPGFQGAGAQIAFYLVMSLIPLIVLLVHLCTLLEITPELVGKLVQDYLNPQAVESVTQVFVSIQREGYSFASGTFSVVAVFVTVWAASKIQFCMDGICNYAYSGKIRARGFVKDRIRALVNVVLLLFVVVASLVALVYGQMILTAVGRFVRDSLGLPFQFNNIWYLVRWPVAIAVYAAVISYIYYSSPLEKPKFRQVIPGSLFAAVAMMVVSLAYSVYISVFAHYDALYGSLASLMVLLLWFYLLGTVFVLGILFNLAWEETKGM